MFHRKSRGDQDNTGTKWRIVHTSQPLVLSTANDQPTFNFGFQKRVDPMMTTSMGFKKDYQKDAHKQANINMLLKRTQSQSIFRTTSERALELKRKIYLQKQQNIKDSLQNIIERKKITIDPTDHFRITREKFQKSPNLNTQNNFNSKNLIDSFRKSQTKINYNIEQLHTQQNKEIKCFNVTPMLFYSKKIEERFKSKQ